MDVYIARYDCLYNTNHIFAKGCFKSSDDHLVPIVYVGNGHDWRYSDCHIGYAVLENRDDGLVAKCSFNHNTEGQIAKDLVVNTKECGLSVYANMIEYGKSDQSSTVKTILSAKVAAVILVPTERMPRVMEENNVQSTINTAALGY